MSMERKLVVDYIMSMVEMVLVQEAVIEHNQDSIESVL
jgi:hypothetical protein